MGSEMCIRDSLVSFEPVVGTCAECKIGFTSKRLRECCRETLCRVLYASGFETSKEQLYREVKNIISSECMFPFPDILPKHLPRDRRVVYMKFITSAIQIQELNSRFFITDDDAEYISVVLRLDLGIELTHSHKYKVSSARVSFLVFI